MPEISMKFRFSFILIGNSDVTKDEISGKKPRLSQWRRKKQKKEKSEDIVVDRLTTQLKTPVRPEISEKIPPKVLGYGGADDEYNHPNKIEIMRYWYLYGNTYRNFTHPQISERILFYKIFGNFSETFSENSSDF
jgi:hypothetical protein